MKTTGSILFVDDEESMREWVSVALSKDGHVVDTAPDGASALARFDQGSYDVVIQDLKMPGMSGIELLRALLERDPTLPVILITAFSTWSTAVEAMRLGAYSYLKKPIEDNDDLRALVQRAIQHHRRLREEPSDELPFLNFIGSTPAIQELLRLVRRVAPTDSTVVIQGESGTGKELVARLLHLYSDRREKPFLGVSCGAFSETLLESELFGHVKGAFTGAIANKKGLFEIAEGGTLFLDEIGEMSLQTQVALLRVLETRTFLPVGGSQIKRTDVRIIAATNRNLQAMVENRTFREDLFYRLHVIPLYLPPLRERREDIPLLAGHFLAQYNRAFEREIGGFDEEALQMLMNWDWPGNVRELQNTIQRAVTLATGPTITAKDIIPARMPFERGVERKEMGPLSPPVDFSRSAAPFSLEIPESFNLEEYLATMEKAYLREALRRTGGNLTTAAKLLGITFRSIRYKVRKLGLER